MDNNRIYEAAGIKTLSKENSEIREENGFPVLYLSDENSGNEKTRTGIVEVKRAFPFECEEEFIILEDEKGEDRGFIRRLDERSESERAILKKALATRYYMPKITKIEKVNDRFGYCYFKVETSSGKCEFSVRDPYRSIVMLGQRMIITDADGSRYEIPDVNALEKKDKRKIEQYLW